MIYTVDSIYNKVVFVDKRAVVSVEYLVVLGVILILVAIVVGLMQNLLQVKDALEIKISEYRNKTIAMF